MLMRVSQLPYAQILFQLKVNQHLLHLQIICSIVIIGNLQTSSGLWVSNDVMTFELRKEKTTPYLRHRSHFNT